MNGLVVYTVLIGDYDVIEDPIIKENINVDFICFSNIPLKSKKWKLFKVESRIDDFVRESRMYKMLPHRFLFRYDRSIYIDANITINDSFIKRALYYLNFADIWFPKHPWNNSIYDEIKTCYVYEKDDKRKLIEIYFKYQKQGMPKSFGLSENNLILRNHMKKEVINIMEEWWKKYCEEGVKRDQLVLSYVLWKNNRSYNFIEEKVRDSEYFLYRPHKLKINIKRRILIKIKSYFLTLRWYITICWKNLEFEFSKRLRCFLLFMLKAFLLTFM